MRDDELNVWMASASKGQLVRVAATLQKQINLLLAVIQSIDGVSSNLEAQRRIKHVIEGSFKAIELLDEIIPPGDLIDKR